MRKRLSAQFAPAADPRASLAVLLGEAADFAAEAELRAGTRDRLAVIIEELASNVARHGATAQAVSLTIDLHVDQRSVMIVLQDDGPPFDPASRAFTGPDPITGGGVGLELVARWCDGMAYTRHDNRNRLELHLPATSGD